MRRLIQAPAILAWWRHCIRMTSSFLRFFVILGKIYEVTTMKNITSKWRNYPVEWKHQVWVLTVRRSPFTEIIWSRGWMFHYRNLDGGPSNSDEDPSLNFRPKSSKVKLVDLVGWKEFYYAEICFLFLWKRRIKNLILKKLFTRNIL